MIPITLTAANTNITAAVTEITVNESVDTLGASLSFKLPWGDGVRYNVPAPALGDPVKLYSGGTCVFTGTITKAAATESERNYTCHDFCWYLNKSKITIQFAAISVVEAISETMSAVGIRVGGIPEMRALAEETCYCETPSSILNRLMERQADNDGYEYHAYASRITDGMINIERLGYQRAHYGAGEITGTERDESLDDVVNRVEYVTGDSSGYYDTGIWAENSASVEKYGMIQDIIIAGDEDKDARAIVNTRIERKSLPHPEATLECAGNFSLRPGLSLPVTVPVTGITGEWIIMSTAHTIKAGEHRMNMTLRQDAAARDYRTSTADDVEANAILILHNAKEGERMHVRN